MSICICADCNYAHCIRSIQWIVDNHKSTKLLPHTHNFDSLMR